MTCSTCTSNLTRDLLACRVSPQNFMSLLCYSESLMDGQKWRSQVPMEIPEKLGIFYVRRPVSRNRRILSIGHGNGGG